MIYFNCGKSKSLNLLPERQKHGIVFHRLHLFMIADIIVILIKK